MLDKSLIGRTSEPGRNEVERGAIRRFAEALGSTHPLHLSTEAARKAGYPGLVAPPTFPATFRAGSDVRAGLGLSEQTVLHNEQVYEHERPIVAGDVITVTERIADVSERSGPAGQMTFLVIESEGQDARGEPVYRGRQVLIVRAP